MTSDEALVAMIQTLNAQGINYMLTGSLASNLYGVPRSTKDADFVVDAQREVVARLLGAIKPPLVADPQMSFEAITATTRQNIKLAGSKYEIELFHLSDDDHDQERFRRRKIGQVAGQTVWVATPEDVVVTKLRWSKQGRRNKDVDDVKSVISVQDDSLDWTYINRWCDTHGTREILDSIRRSIPQT